MIQEMTIILDKVEYVVYITELEMTDKGLRYAFGCKDEKMNDILAPHIEDCLRIQIDEEIKIYRNISLWDLIKKYFFMLLWGKK